MELAEAYRASHRCIADFAETNGDKERAALQAEVTRLEAELAELRAEQVAREAQKPFAWSIFDGEGGEYFVAYECNETYKADYEIRNPNHLNWVNPLYTAAGVKEPNHG